MARLWLTIILISSLSGGQVFAQCQSDIDFRTWVQEGILDNGDWEASKDSVLQTINGDPTFFVSPDTFINVKIDGRIRVNTQADDDHVGFVFGFKSPLAGSDNYDCWLFDWKQTEQNFQGSTSLEGFSLVKLKGRIPETNLLDYFWAHKPDNLFDVVATNYGPGTGWKDETDYDFTLIYTPSRVTISINSDTIFSIPGCFERGRFGFYNYSQANVIYSNFSYVLMSNFELLTPKVCTGQEASFQFIDPTCNETGNNLVKWEWDFGDGNFSTEINPTHAYNDSGFFSVQMRVTDLNGCQDSISRQIEVESGLPPFSLGNDTSLCPGEVLFLDPGLTGIPYTWQDGSQGNTFMVTGPGEYSVQVTGTDCAATKRIQVDYESDLSLLDLGVDTILCETHTLVLDPALTGKINYRWQDGSSSPTFEVEKKGTYRVEVQNKCGTHQDEIDVTYDDCKCHMYFATGFSPNDDGKNDAFFPVYQCKISNAILKVYNRWGNLIFETTEIDQGWNGRDRKGGISPEGVYVVVLTYTAETATGKEDLTRSGSLMLMR